MSESTTPQLSNYIHKKASDPSPHENKSLCSSFPLKSTKFLQGKWERFVSEKEVMTTAPLHIHLTSLSLDPTRRVLLLYNEYAIALSHTLHCPSWMINRLQKFIYICIDKRFLQFNHLIFSFVAFLKVSLLSSDFFFFFQAAPFPFKLNRTHVLMWQIFF